MNDEQDAFFRSIADLVLERMASGDRAESVMVLESVATVLGGAVANFCEEDEELGARLTSEDDRRGGRRDVCPTLYGTHAARGRGMSGIIPFDFESHAVRIVMQHGAPWFVAADVCRVLEISKHRDAIAKLDSDERAEINPLDLNAGGTGRSSGSHGGARRMAIVNESGLYALIIRSSKPAAKRFRKWVTAEVLPAIRRDGYYAMPGASAPDLEELAEKRVYLESLPEDQRAIARAKYEALCKIADAIEAGEKVSHAVRAAAAESGYSEKTLWNCRAATYMVPRCDWEAALAPKWRRRQGGMMVECHPEALRFFEGLAATGQRITDCYRRTTEVAAERGWQPVPGIHVLRRHAARVLSHPVRRSVSA